MLAIRLLGNFALEYEGRQLKLNAPPRAISLLAYLLLRATPQPREQLAAQLWPEEADETARANLRRHLNHLSHALPPGDWLLTSRNTLQWNPDAPYTLDVSAFVQACQHDDPAALDLYRGDLLTDLFDEWLIYEREQLRNLYLTTLNRLAQQAIVQHHYADSATYAKRLCEAEPLHEDYLRLLLTSRYAAGDRAGALAEYDRFRRELQAELAATPMPETVALYETILHNASLPTLATPNIQPAAASPTHQAFILPFAGREAEMQQLRHAWQAATQRQGGLVLISGEAGIGKTRLTAELAALALQGGRVLRGAVSANEDFPYQAIVTALRSALPLLASLAATNAADLSAILPLLPELRRRLPNLAPLPRLEAKQERDRLHTALAACLFALGQPRPLLLILEDLHWAGAATLDFIRFLSRQISDQPLLVVATYREGEVERSHPLHELRRNMLQAAHGQHLALSPLDEAVVAGIVGQVAELDASDHEQYRAAEGNPFFLSELVAAQLEGNASPSGGRSIVSERVARLHANTRLFAEVAAIAGAAFDADLVREVAGWSSGQALTALDELLDRNLVRDEGRREGYDYAFSHHLIQETIYAAIAPAVRSRRHRRTALVLEEFYPERRDELAATLARHFDFGEEAARAADYYLRAAQRAASLYADVELLAAATRAAELSADPHTQFAAYALCEDAYRRQAEREAQANALAAMQRIVDETEDPQLRGAYLRRQIVRQSELDDRAGEQALIDELAALADETADRHLQAIALLQRGIHQNKTSQYDAAQISIEEALARYRELGDQHGVVECYQQLIHIATFQGRFATAETMLAQAKAASREGDQGLLLQILHEAALNAAMRDEYETCREIAEEILARSRMVHDRLMEAHGHMLFALAAANLGIPDATFAHVTQAQQLYIRFDNLRGQAVVLGIRARLYEKMTRYPEAIESYRQAATINERNNDPRPAAGCMINIASCATNLGDYAAAIAAAQYGLELMREVNAPIINAYLITNLGWAEWLVGDDVTAINHLEAALELWRSIEPPVVEAMACAFVSLILSYLALGQHNAAQRHVVAALALTDTDAQILWAAACYYRAQGDTARCRDYLDRAYAALQEEIDTLRQQLGEYADADWEAAYFACPFVRAITLSYREDVWPPFAPAVLLHTYMDGFWTVAAL